jgi:glycosyltransferase involved in cell wall biosynthesis
LAAGAENIETSSQKQYTADTHRANACQNMSLRLVITTTLNNNLFLSFLLPLARSRPDLELVVVTDREGPEVERVRWVYPRGFSRLFGRLGARILLLAKEIFHPRTRLVMAYNVVPHGLLALPLAKLRGVPIYFHFYAGYAEIHFAHNPRISHNRVIVRSKHPQRIERMADWVSRRADMIFVPGPKTEAFLVNKGYDPKKIAELHTAIDLERFYPGNSVRDFDVVVVAQININKRAIFTLEILAEVAERKPGAKFCWLGDGPLHDEFGAALDRLGLREAMTWTLTDNVTPYYQRSRAFLLASMSEGMSQGCMEAMACGVVPVTSDTGDMAHVVRPGKTGQVLPVDAPASQYADAIVRFLSDDALWQRHSQASHELIVKEHSFETIIRLWSQILDKLAPSQQR